MIILVDFDRTLYDTDRMIRKRNEVYSIKGIYPPLVEILYSQVKDSIGYYSPKHLYHLLNKVQNGLGDRVREIDKRFHYGKYLYPFSRESLEALKCLGYVLIFTKGDISYQRRKILSCNLNTNFLIVKDKSNFIPEGLLKYLAMESESKSIVVIDDQLDELRNIPDYVNLFGAQIRIRKIIVGNQKDYDKIRSLGFEHYDNILYAAEALKNSKK